ncbi:hypothetical protein D3C73_831330 [compost metagenome]
MLFYAVYSGVNGNRPLSNKRLNVVIGLAECQQLIDRSAALADQGSDFIGGEIEPGQLFYNE